MLLVYDGQAQIPELNILLEHGMGANQHVDIAAFQRFQFVPAHSTFVAACQNIQTHPGLIRQGLQPLHMLARKNFCWRHHHTLAASLDRDKQGHEGHQSFARANIAL